MSKNSFFILMHILVAVFADQEVKDRDTVPPKTHHFRDDANLVYCHVQHCELINEFKLAANTKFNCYEQYLGITFDIFILNDHGNDTEKLNVLSYVYNDERDYNRDFNVLSNQQKISTTCKQIRR